MHVVSSENCSPDDHLIDRSGATDTLVQFEAVQQQLQRKRRTILASIIADIIDVLFLQP